MEQYNFYSPLKYNNLLLIIVNYNLYWIINLHKYWGYSSCIINKLKKIFVGFKLRKRLRTKKSGMKNDDLFFVNYNFLLNNSKIIKNNALNINIRV